MRTVAYALMFVVACSGGSKPPPADPTTASLLDCPRVADHVAATLSSSDVPRPGASPAAIRDLVASRCQADAWTDETKRCLHAIKTFAEGRACATTMTDEQRTAIRTQARAMRQDASTAPDDTTSDWVRHVVEEPAQPKPQ